MEMAQEKENTGVEFAGGGGAVGKWVVVLREVQEFRVEKSKDEQSFRAS